LAAVALAADQKARQVAAANITQGWATLQRKLRAALAADQQRRLQPMFMQVGPAHVQHLPLCGLQLVLRATVAPRTVPPTIFLLFFSFLSRAAPG
jgi:hypothetical protein